MVDFNSVLTAARQLSDEDQLRLMDELFPAEADEAAELSPEWETEIERRVAQMEAGEATFTRWEVVRKETRRRLGLPDGD